MTEEVARLGRFPLPETINLLPNQKNILNKYLHRIENKSINTQLTRLRAALDADPGFWANTKNGLGNLAACTAGQLAAVVRNRLKRIQYRPALIDGFPAQTGLSLEPEPP